MYILSKVVHIQIITSKKSQGTFGVLVCTTYSLKLYGTLKNMVIASSKL